ncbi:N-myc 2 proto-oncogene protein [Choanephora cucurbitarum]|uniref:N-myc 2 proto-oncogene protein n=1 Tax=Choanephora cucurbitarum TaxID=101091 RepID=A0A1C7NKQ5_9FUNG|nr:N-myc 2 proto-oncogene protein [Choanephora cucurbitarum]
MISNQHPQVLTPIYLRHADYTLPHLTPVSQPPLRKKQQRPIQPYPDHSPPSEKCLRDSLTDDEKRANHILSEQKRRNTIRSGFKELTEMIPTLKNINHSKSTILFKAVDYINHLERHNRSLHDKLAGLQLRIQKTKKTKPTPISHDLGHLPPNTVNALLIHKQQQQQLEELQVQLRSQQRLLTKHHLFSHLLEPSKANTAIYRSIAIPTHTSST